MMSKEFTTNAFPQTTFSPQQVMEREALVNFFFQTSFFRSCLAQGCAAQYLALMRVEGTPLRVRLRLSNQVKENCDLCSRLGNQGQNGPTGPSSQIKPPLTPRSS